MQRRQPLKRTVKTNVLQTPILLEVRKSDPLFDIKCTFYRRDLAIPQRRLRVSISENENTKVLLAMLRVIEADRDDFDLLVSCSGNTLYRSLRDAQVAISIKNEIRAMNTLATICDNLLGAYPSSYEADCERLKSDQIAPFSNERHALIQVKGEKEVLLYLKDLALTSTALLCTADFSEFDELLETVRCTKHVLIFQHARSTLSRLHQDEQRRQELRRRKFDLSRPTVV